MLFAWCAGIDTRNSSLACRYVITSSPLDLGHNISDDAVNDRVWPVVSNLEAIAINQQCAWHRSTAPSALSTRQTDLVHYVRPRARHTHTDLGTLFPLIVKISAPSLF